MAIQNRDLDSSVARQTYQWNGVGTASGVSAGILNPGLSTGTTFPMVTIGFPSQLTAVETSVWGLSGAPVHSIWLYRFAGGFTSIQMGACFAVTAFGTSGALAFSLYASSSFLLQTGDEIVLYAQASNAAVASAQVAIVVTALQDIKKDFGV